MCARLNPIDHGPHTRRDALGEIDLRVHHFPMLACPFSPKAGEIAPNSSTKIFKVVASPKP